MLVVIGWVLAAACVIISFLGSGGHVAVLWQPFEVLVICGGALGAFLASNNKKVLKATLTGVMAALRGAPYNKAVYLEVLALLYEILNKIRMSGLKSIDDDIEAPGQSALFSKYPTVMKDAHLADFIVDYLRMMVMGNLNSHEVADVMDAELETHHEEAHAPVAAIARIAGGLPAFGIVAAVLGVVHTMASVGQPPAVLGGMIAAALVGTFLGILLAYGFVEPLGAVLEARAQEEAKAYLCVKTVLVANMNGYAPPMAVEFGRKVLLSDTRPTFHELEEAVKGRR